VRGDPICRGGKAIATGWGDGRPTTETYSNRLGADGDRLGPATGPVQS